MHFHNSKLEFPIQNTEFSIVKMLCRPMQQFWMQPWLRKRIELLVLYFHFVEDDFSSGKMLYKIVFSRFKTKQIFIACNRFSYCIVIYSYSLLTPNIFLRYLTIFYFSFNVCLCDEVTINYFNLNECHSWRRENEKESWSQNDWEKWWHFAKMRQFSNLKSQIMANDQRWVFRQVFKSTKNGLEHLFNNHFIVYNTAWAYFYFVAIFSQIFGWFHTFFDL